MKLDKKENNTKEEQKSLINTGWLIYLDLFYFKNIHLITLLTGMRCLEDMLSPYLHKVWGKCCPLSSNSTFLQAGEAMVKACLLNWILFKENIQEFSSTSKQKKKTMKNYTYKILQSYRHAVLSGSGFPLYTANKCCMWQDLAGTSSHMLPNHISFL